MMNGAGEFNKAASASYKELDATGRKRLEEIATSMETGGKQMTVRDLKKAASKSFSKIRREVCTSVRQ